VRYNTPAGPLDIAPGLPTGPHRLAPDLDGAARFVVQKWDILATTRKETAAATHICQADVDRARRRIDHDEAQLAAAIQWLREELPPKPTITAAGTGSCQRSPV
jgi:hypothetical protein